MDVKAVPLWDAFFHFGKSDLELMLGKPKSYRQEGNTVILQETAAGPNGEPSSIRGMDKKVYKALRREHERRNRPAPAPLPKPDRGRTVTVVAAPESE